MQESIILNQQKQVIGTAAELNAIKYAAEEKLQENYIITKTTLSKNSTINRGNW